MLFEKPKKKKTVFITGTDTGVGKTYISALLAQIYLDLGYTVGYLKPVETGCDPLCNDTFNITQITGQPFDEALVYSFQEPAAPYAAALKENRSIDISKIKERYDKLRKKYDLVIVEGAGGLLVPITKVEGQLYTYLELVKDLDIPVVVVAKSTIGTINHTALTARCLQERQAKVNGIILNKYPKNPDWAEKTNPDIIKELTKIDKVITLPTLVNGLTNEDRMKLQMLV
jgi:dethiobiotin synthetase